MIDRMLVMDDAHAPEAGRLVRVRADVHYDPAGEHRTVYRQRFASVCMCGRPVGWGGCVRCRWGRKSSGHGPAGFDVNGPLFDPGELEQLEARKPGPPRGIVTHIEHLSESEVAAFARAAAYRR